jgi:predicted HicB family RNase H-like nuclease
VATKATKRTIKEKANYYTYRGTWSAEDNEFVGLCAEFPSLSWLAHTKEEALRGISSLVEEVISDMLLSNEHIPEPLATRHFSGKFTTRIPPEIHRSLTIQAAEANISFNRLVSSKLSR